MYSTQGTLCILSCRLHALVPLVYIDDTMYSHPNVLSNHLHPVLFYTMGKSKAPHAASTAPVRRDLLIRQAGCQSFSPRIITALSLVSLSITRPTLHFSTIAHCSSFRYVWAVTRVCNLRKFFLFPPMRPASTFAIFRTPCIGCNFWFCIFRKVIFPSSHLNNRYAFFLH